tara:strand:- start:61 stop:1356 length:1296 start_codon:yes stop_codon:yes gene_type:complete
VIINPKFLLYLTLIFFGAYIFYFEYQNIINLNVRNINITKFEINTKNNLNFKSTEKIEVEKEKIKEERPILPLNKKEITVSKGETLSSILKNFNLSEKKIYEIVNKISNFYDLKKLRINQKINFYLDANGVVKKIEIEKEIDRTLVINITNEVFIEEIELEKQNYTMSQEFIILESLYSDGIKNNVPQSILIELIRLFSFDLDFQRDIKSNTTVSISYDVIEIKENNNLKYDDINYALISIEGKKIEYFKFITDEGFVDYFNREGKNVKKSILKTPLDGARLSSNFGMRKHPISGYNKMHKGVDFAAPKGTPIYAGGNGVIEFVGNNGGYGKYIRIRHNNEYKTAYAHLSQYKKGISVGKRVNQGDVIGFVGSTGNSTGPHLHYEIIYRNKHINPMKLKLPSGKVLEGNELKRFNKEFKIIYANHLNLLYE